MVHLSRRVALVLTGAACLCLAGMMLLTVADVVLRGAANTPILGTYEIVSLLLCAVIFFALPDTFRRREHITVDLIDGWIGAARRRVLILLGSLLSLALVGLMLWRMVPQALDTWEFGETTLDLALPTIVLWAPLLLGSAIAILVLVVDLVSGGRDEP